MLFPESESVARYYRVNFANGEKLFSRFILFGYRVAPTHLRIENTTYINDSVQFCRYSCPIDNDLFQPTACNYFLIFHCFQNFYFSHSTFNCITLAFLVTFRTLRTHGRMILLCAFFLVDKNYYNTSSTTTTRGTPE